jgi:hypothetical protein
MMNLLDFCLTNNESADIYVLFTLIIWMVSQIPILMKFGMRIALRVGSPSRSLVTDYLPSFWLRPQQSARTSGLSRPSMSKQRSTKQRYSRFDTLSRPCGVRP